MVVSDGDSAIDRLLEGVTLEDILDREGVDYRCQHGSRGEQLNIKTCPFCGGSDWKVYANRDSGLGNCFHGSCQETFNRYKITKQLIGAATANEVRLYLEALARELGFRPRRTHSVEVAVEMGTAWKMPTSIPLPTADGRNLQYLEERGISGEIAKRFHLRYCHDGWFNFTRPDGTPSGVKFSERVIIPVFNLAGDLVTFQGRDITGTSTRKYLFPPGLPGTSAFLYNGHVAAGTKRVIVCEGAFDVIGAWKAVNGGVEFADMGVVGTFGMHLSAGRDGEDQLAQFLALKGKGLESVYLMWDGEPVAWKKAVATAARLGKIGLNPYVCALPAGKDPSDATAYEIHNAIRDAACVTQRTAIRLSLSSPYR